MENMDLLIILGIVVLPTIIVFLLSHSEDMTTAMNYYKYHVSFNSDNSVRVITEKGIFG